MNDLPWLTKLGTLFNRHTEWIAVLISFISLVFGPFIGFLTSLVGYTKDRSWDQRAIKNTALVAQCIRDLQEAEKTTSGVGIQALEPYSTVLKERLEFALLQLQLFQKRQAAYADKQAARSRALFKGPTGVQRWLLWYRPYGFAAWILHLAFYGILCMNVVFVVHLSGYHHAGDATSNAASVLAYFIKAASVLAYGGLAFFARSVALRSRRFGALTKGQLNPNSDLNWFRRLFLIFRAPGKLAAIERFFAWLLVLYGLVGICTEIATGGPRGFKKEFVPIVILIFLSWILSYDIRLRRGLSKIGAFKPLGSDPVSSPRNAPLTKVRAAGAGGSRTN